MSAAAQLQLSAPAPGVLAMSGALVFATAARALAEARPAVARGDVTTLDLAGVTAADSAGLAVLIALRRAGRARGVDVAIRALPPTLRALAQLGEVEELLGLSA
ncbi:STAS domain-containing protein [Tahibacter caeni]|uniref:STAS domain-containing protein n=1 Tax=Tahibacter caeni TaxID=1453545 RepID=UPI002148556B|nr:STAS domain-containing protein [Tahibacter caeni]